MSLQAIKYERGSLQLLDQRLLPHEFTYLQVPDPQTSWKHIKDMVVRGAPAIGVTGVLTLAVDLVSNKGAGSAFASVADAVTYITSTADYLVTSRPTAVNLADGLDKVKAAAQKAAAAAGATPSSVVEAVVAAAEEYFHEDILCNKAIGAYGAAAVLDAVAATGRNARPSGGLRVLTHCNTGSLATAGYGTALGIIRALHEQGKLEHAYCTETRPYNQGARLTAFELAHDGIPATLVCDSATSYLMSLGQVDAVIVGADRVVSNGDTANKIGTYMLSVIAAKHNVPFFVAAPTTTLDAVMGSGAEIEIEQRPAEEITHFKGQRVVTENIKVWNPSFDVAPGSLITGIVTEKGVIPKAGDTHKVREFVTSLSAANGTSQQNGHVVHPYADGAALKAVTAESSSAFYALNTETVKDYVKVRPDLAKHVGDPSTAATWRVNEVGDGNINFVYIIEGPAGGLAVKQCLPFVRCVGESWPLTQDRVRIEAEALAIEAQYSPAYVPAVYLYDSAMALIAMQYIAPPNIILRKGLIQGLTYPEFADHISEFLATNLFGTSLLAVSSKEHKALQQKFVNPEMCELTEKVIFTEPYTMADNNRHTSPQLDADVAALRDDVEAKVAISALKQKFMTSTEALLHGDLHTGSVMVSQGVTMVIDPEFAFYGPMAFDVAKILANLLLALFASPGQEVQDKSQGSTVDRAAQREWLQSCIASTWTQFHAKFLKLWDAQGLKGDAYPEALLGPGKPKGPEGLKACQQAFLQQLWNDTVSFMGAFVIRRLVGIAHVADMDCIADADLRASCERRALKFGRTLLVTPGTYATVDALVGAAATAATPQ